MILLDILKEGQNHAKQALGGPGREDGGSQKLGRSRSGGSGCSLDFFSRVATLLGHVWELAPGCLASRGSWGRLAARSWSPAARTAADPTPTPPPTHPAGSPSLQLPLLAGCLATAALICSCPEQTARRWRASVFSGCVERRCEGVVPPRLLQRMPTPLWGPLVGHGRLGRLHLSFLAFGV